MRFHSQPIPEHGEVPLADDGRWEEIVETWSEKTASPTAEKAVYVVSVSQQRDPMVRQAQLAEILSLTRAEGNQVVGHEILTLTKPRPRTLIGKGTSRELAARARNLGATMLVLDAELTPSQMRNLEDEAGIPICDREGVILNVFLRHARSRHARIQVEIARLEYLRPRIRGVGLDMDQQMGGVKGSRGPGETASELLARQLDGRLAELRKANAKLQKAGDNRRQRRQDCEQIALVGYTNAGKTALMNALTEGDFSSADQPFETLDTVSRSLSRHGGGVVLSDTVGFIRRLPERLLASFESTLAEAREASLLAVVTDISDHEWQDHVRITLDLLERMGAGDIPRHFIFNKADLVETVPQHELREASGSSPYSLVSALDESSTTALRTTLLEKVRRHHRDISILIPYTASHILNSVYSACRVTKTRPCERGLRLNIQASEDVIRRLKKQLKEVV